MEYYIVIGYSAASLNNNRRVLGMYSDLESARNRQKEICGVDWHYSRINNKTITTNNGDYTTIVTKFSVGDMDQWFLGKLY